MKSLVDNNNPWLNAIRLCDNHITKAIESKDEDLEKQWRAEKDYWIGSFKNYLSTIGA